MSSGESRRLVAAFVVSERGMTSLGATDDGNSKHYTVGRLLSMKNDLNTKSFHGIIAGIWDMKWRLSIKADGDCHNFCFEVEEARDRVLHEGLWFYNNKSNLEINQFDGVEDVRKVPMQLFPVWVKILGGGGGFDAERRVIRRGGYSGPYNRGGRDYRGHHGPRRGP